MRVMGTTRLGESRCSSLPFGACLGRLGYSYPPTEPVEDDQKISDFITNTVWEDLEIIYPTPEDPTPAPSTPPKKTKKVWHKKKKTSSPVVGTP